jgi:hypothetical protein
VWTVWLRSGSGGQRGDNLRSRAQAHACSARLVDLDSRICPPFAGAYDGIG